MVMEVCLAAGISVSSNLCRSTGRQRVGEAMYRPACRARSARLTWQRWPRVRERTSIYIHVAFLGYDLSV